MVGVGDRSALGGGGGFDPSHDPVIVGVRISSGSVSCPEDLRRSPIVHGDPVGAGGWTNVKKSTDPIAIGGPGGKTTESDRLEVAEEDIALKKSCISGGCLIGRTDIPEV